MVAGGAFCATYGILARSGDNPRYILDDWPFIAHIALFLAFVLVGWVVGRSAYVGLLRGNEDVGRASAVGFGIALAFAAAGMVLCFFGLLPWLWIPVVIAFAVALIVCIVLLAPLLGAAPLIILGIIFAAIGAVIAWWLSRAV
jgi:hypothetical protein